MTSRRMKQARELLGDRRLFAPEQAVEFIQKTPAPKFDESVEVALDLNLDPKKADQLVRGTVVLPHGTGKPIRVIVLAKGPAAARARQAGADHVGAEDLIEKIQGGWLDFDVAIATPDLMREVAKLGKLLGPRGLMPSPKAGTVTPDPAKAVREAKAGKVEFKMDKQGGIRLGIGKRSFPREALVANLRALLEAVQKARPASAKGRYVRSVSISSTMGPGVRLDLAEAKLS